MEDKNLKLLKEELSTQLDSYSFNDAAIDILNHVISNENDGADMTSSNEKFDRILSAKNDWESCVDALEHQAMIILDDELRVIRANRTIELWGWADVKNVAGTHILNLIKPAIENDSISDWVDEWCQLDIQKSVEWESNNTVTGKKFRFSFYPNKDIDSLYHNDDFYAVLVIADITNEKNLVSKKNLLNGRLVDEVHLDDTLNNKLAAESEQRLHKLADQLINSQADERRRVSSELHDGVGQILSALKYQVEALLHDSNTTFKKRKSDIIFSDVLDNIKIALSDLRRISVDLRPSVLEDLGLLMTLRWFTGEYNKVYSTLNVDLKIDASESEIKEEHKAVIYRITQEAMNNIAKHAKANNILLSLTKSKSGLLLRISDDGCGFNLKEIKEDKDRGLGLDSMEERALKSDATFKMSSNVLSGTVVQVFWENY